MATTDGGSQIPPQRRIDPTAVASLWTAVFGAIVWWAIGGLTLLLLATVSLALGIVALFRIKRNGRTGRFAAIVGIAFGFLYYAMIVTYTVRYLQPLFVPGAPQP